MGMRKFFRSGGRIAWGLIGAMLLLMVASTALFARTALVRHERDVSRMVFNDNLQLLDDVRKSTGALDDSLSKMSGTSASDAIPTNRPYLVVSIEDHRLWYKQGDSVLFTTQVATGSGKVLEAAEGQSHWKFETPRGRLVIQSKEEDPAWIPPDWHFVEMARKRGLGIVRLNRGQSVPASDGSVITVEGTDMVRKYRGRPHRPDRAWRGGARGGGRGQHRDPALRHQPAEVQRGAGHTPPRTWATATRCTVPTSRRALAARSATGACGFATRTSRCCTRWFRWARPSSYIEHSDARSLTVGQSAVAVACCVRGVARS